MMKRIIRHILTVISALMLCGCVEEEMLPDGKTGLSGGEGMLTLRFGAEEQLNIVTRSTLNPYSESRVSNIYVFIFDAAGNKIYGYWFDDSNLQTSEAAVGASSSDCWWVENMTADGKVTKTTGCVKVKAPAGSGFKVYILANLDSDMVRISSELLSHNINSETDLLNFPVYLNQETVFRNGYFPMSGQITGVTIPEGIGGDINDKNLNPIVLRRLDSKIKFNFIKGTWPDAKGQVIKNFEAKQWRVMNVPKTSYLIGKPGAGNDSGDVPPTTSSADYSQKAAMFFDTEWENFERFPDANTSEFSFYMLENRQIPKNEGFTDYNDRSRQLKETSGANEGRNRMCEVTYINSQGNDVTRQMRLFANANDFSTYILVTGRVEMDLVNDDQGQTLGGDVQYLIHLGNWSFTEGTGWDSDVYGGVTNFETLRNASYTYNVTVNSVNNIRVEVESDISGAGTIENQPGASGSVTVAKEEIMVCDAHYSSKTLSFHARNFVRNGESTANDLTWRVKTPFGEGSPIIEDGIDIPAGLDYKWVRFRLNKKDENGMYFNDKRRKYTSRVFEYSDAEQDNPEDDGTPGLRGRHNDGTMDIIELVKYIKAQTRLYINDDIYGTKTSDFDQDVDESGNPDPKISITAFVDEFYYDNNPVTGVSSPTLWKKFVNQPDRLMHILCNSDVSKDFESRATGSVITIQQKAIQCIYNTDLSYTELLTAWGTEQKDEHERKSDGVTSNNWPYSNVTSLENRGNTDSYNGRLNTAREWSVCYPNDLTFNPTGVKWSEYANIEVDNETPQLRADRQFLRYVCITRNRDNNGNGVIDKDELRWYMAADKQLLGMGIGKGLLNKTTQLYNRTMEERQDPNAAVWRQHVVSSTSHKTDKNSNNPNVIWAEEGFSSSSYLQSKQWEGTQNFSVRCVRNLGIPNDAALDVVPQDIVSANNQYIDATHLNSGALRYYTSRELDAHVETAEENQPYKKMEVASADTGKQNICRLLHQTQ